jgi:4a-hydroxytetrahydrobiopterin dehydratase
MHNCIQAHRGQTPDGYVEKEAVVNTATLAQKSCIPCSGGIPPLTGKPLKSLHAQLQDEWALIEEHHLERTFPFPDFATALRFTNALGALAETEGHHPEITVTWGRVTVRIWTHKIDGLTESDFVLAAKVERIPTAEAHMPTRAGDGT